ncbi:MAG TPA: hypothetical protein VNQ76_08015 [Planctomicrobium sp.]|nr:hypothetical protein [Planctomicrobium sp.]
MPWLLFGALADKIAQFIIRVFMTKRSPTLFVLVTLFSVCCFSCASSSATHVQIAPEPVPHCSESGYETGYAPSTGVAVAAPQRQGVFARLWELEKRKNAAILRFLGWR